MGSAFSDETLVRLQNLLSNYAPKQELLDACKAITIGAVVGPAGSGKDTLRQALLNTHPSLYSLLLSDTSRPKRPSEQDGVEYHFKALEQMLDGFEKGDYLQGAIVHGQQLSGLNAQEILQIPKGKMPLSILVIQTIEQLVSMGLTFRTVFLVPPSLDAMKERLSIRQGVSEEERKRRLQTAAIELELALQHDDFQFIITDKLQRPLRIAEDFFKTGIIDENEQERAIPVVRELLESL